MTLETSCKSLSPYPTSKLPSMLHSCSLEYELLAFYPTTILLFTSEPSATPGWTLASETLAKINTFHKLLLVMLFYYSNINIMTFFSQPSRPFCLSMSFGEVLMCVPITCHFSEFSNSSTINILLFLVSSTPDILNQLPCVYATAGDNFLLYGQYFYLVVQRMSSKENIAHSHLLLLQTVALVLQTWFHIPSVFCLALHLPRSFLSEVDKIILNKQAKSGLSPYQMSQ